MISDEKHAVILIYSSIGKLFCLRKSFKIFSLPLTFCITEWGFGIYPVWICDLVSVINFGTFLAIIHIFLPFYSLFSFQYSNYMYVTPFEIIPQLLDVACFSFYFLLFSLGSFYWSHFKLKILTSRLFPELYQIHWWAYLKAFLHFWYNVFLEFPFCYFLEFLSTLPSALAHCLLLPLKPISY